MPDGPVQLQSGGEDAAKQHRKKYDYKPLDKNQRNVRSTEPNRTNFNSAFCWPWPSHINLMLQARRRLIFFPPPIS
jgi:hypothetical protein